MNVPPAKYLCSIPVLDEASPENRTAAELAKAEETRELARASQRGWELLAPMAGHCLHFMSGWWSYRFCYGRNIVQYHALPQVANGAPPVQDPDTLAFMLGKSPAADEAAGASDQDRKDVEVQVKGDQRYLVQRLGGGTTCDLTGRDRTVEVQYHCAPGAGADRIGWIKEVTTCAYLMVVNTPRLCDDPAFLPPRETTANPITCHPITVDGRSEHPQAALSGGDPPVGRVLGSTSLVHPPVVGGVVVGGHNILAGAGDSAFNLEVPRSYVPHARGVSDGKPSVEVVASAKSKEEGGEVTVMSDEELEVMDIEPEFVRGLVDELIELAGDRGWRLEVVEVPGKDRELMGIVDVEEGENLGTLMKDKEANDEADGYWEEEGEGEGEGEARQEERPEQGERGGEKKGVEGARGPFVGGDW